MRDLKKKECTGKYFCLLKFDSETSHVTKMMCAGFMLHRLGTLQGAFYH